MKIAIIGYAGSGKSTLAENLSKKFNLPILHIDKISFNPNWVEKNNEERKDLMKDFLDSNETNWVIDGTYSKVYFEERMQQADKIIFLNFNRFTCYFQALKRAFKYKNKHRDSAPKGCNEKFSLSFQWWILYTGRTKKRKQLFIDTVNNYSSKVVILKKRREVQKYLNSK